LTGLESNDMISFIMIRILPLFLIFYLVSGCASHHQGPELVGKGVRFTFSASMARSVAIVRSFNNWDPRRNMLGPSKDRSEWSITLPLSPGKYEYLFVIDNKTWMPDPEAPEVDDGMGGRGR